MEIQGLKVQNYKSLRGLVFSPKRLSAVVGANAAGKSNLADCLDFLADAYRHGLPVAVARKGGYENIAHRKMRRSRGAVRLQVQVELEPREVTFWPASYSRTFPRLRFDHQFSFRAEGRSIRADFVIESESIRVHGLVKREWRELAFVEREGGRVSYRALSPEEADFESARKLLRQFQLLEDIEQLAAAEALAPTDLLATSLSRFVPAIRILTDGMSRMRVFQFSPTKTREFGVPIPDPEMDRYGGNLPAVVDLLIQRNPRAWEEVLQVMRRILPGLEKIEVDYTHSRTLGLYVHEHGVGRPWNVAEISDGTIHSLALLVALFDPRSTILFLEEPENSVHAWILRNLMDAARLASKRKQIIFTTHSRLVVDSIASEDLWIMWRQNGESHLARAAHLEPSFPEMVQEGDITAFDFLDTGAIPQALPPDPGQWGAD